MRDDDAITSVGGKDGSKMTDLPVSASVRSVERAHECKLVRARSNSGFRKGKL